MQIGLRRVKEVTLNVYREVQRTRVLNMAAGLSYYFLLSLFPVLIALAPLLGYLPIPNLFEQSMDFAARFVPSEAMGLVRRILQSVLTPNRGGLLSIGLIGTLWAASGGFSAMVDALKARSRTLVESVEPLGIFTALDVPDRFGPAWSQRRS